MADLLTTKLYIPPRKLRLVSRPRLIQRMNEGLGGKLILLSAPPGFGKTTLLSEWVSQSNLPAAWVTLDEGDNDLSLFLSYLIAATQAIQPGCGENVLAMLQSPPTGPLEAMLPSLMTALVNEMASAGQRFILILDDFHTLLDKAVLSAVSFLIDHLPQQVVIVIATRFDPPLPLASLRGRRQLTELRSADLRFRPEEVAAFLNQVMELDLEAQAITALSERTEGWACGLVLAALALQDRQDASAFIQDFTGSDRYILDYLFEEVLNRQPLSTQTFLVYTSILERMSGPLCDVVIENREWKIENSQPILPPDSEFSGQSILEYLEQANLFIVPLDNERRWYRYHRLFADLLKHRLNRLHRNILPQLHRRAASWLEGEGYLGEAFVHWIEAKDFTHAARLIEIHALKLLDEGQLRLVSNWLSQIPSESYSNHPRLHTIDAWVLLLSGQMRRQSTSVETRLEEAGKAMAEGAISDETEIRFLMGQAEAIQAYVAAMRRDITSTIQHAQRALELLPEEAQSIRSVVAFTLGGMQLIRDDLPEAKRALENAVTLSQRAGNIHVAIPAMNSLARLYIAEGRLHQAREMYEDALKLATPQERKPHPVAAGVYAGIGELFFEWNDLQAAEGYLEKSLELSHQWGNVDTLLRSHASLALLRSAQGDFSSALDLIRQAEQAAQNRTLTPGTESWFTACKIQLLLSKGDWRAVEQLVQMRGLSSQAPINFFSEIEMLAFARFLAARGDLDEAAGLAERLLNSAQSSNRVGREIVVLAFLAWLYHRQQKEQRAVSTLGKALALAEPEGYLRTFVDEGEPMRMLISDCPTAPSYSWPQGHGRLEIEKRPIPKHAEPRERLKNYIDRLLSAFVQVKPLSERKPEILNQQSSISNLIEALTPRELELLRLIAAGLSNEEIAQKLVISLGTVKAHTSNIYRKLDVSSRTQAVRRAQELKLL